MSAAPLPKVRLRAMEPEDLDLLYSIENDASVWSMGPTNVPFSRFLLHEYMANATGDIYTDKQVRLVIENERGDTVGLLDLTNFDPKHLRAEIGIVVLLQERRKGYARAALCQVLRYAVETLHLHQLYVVISEQNVAPLALFAEQGFKQTGRLPHWLYDGRHYHDAIVMQCLLCV